MLSLFSMTNLGDTFFSLPCEKTRAYWFLPFTLAGALARRVLFWALVPSTPEAIFFTTCLS